MERQIVKAIVRNYSKDMPHTPSLCLSSYFVPFYILSMFNYHYLSYCISSTLFYYLSFLLENKFHDKFSLFSIAVSLAEPWHLVSTCFICE